MFGRDGSDALISNEGADDLRGGDGNDQLVTNTICVAHHFSGGGGIQDIAGFARVQDVGIEARLGGTAKARNDSSCAATVVDGDLEILEGTSQNDVLAGTNGSDTIYARQGDDLLKGLRGEDRLFGSVGRDDCWGGGGPTLFDSCEIKRK
jgi:Ca2+-binding RTX toxin-like protein